MILINLTPHDLALFDHEGKAEIARIPKSGNVARVLTQATEIDSVEVEMHHVSVVSTEYGKVEGLPEALEETMYIVSVLVTGALKALEIKRNDVVAPDTGPQSVVRDADGNILGVRRFTR